MGEIKQLLVVLTLTVIIGILGLSLSRYIPILLEGDVVVLEYRAEFYLNGTLVEEYVYEVRKPGKFKMLYRIWDAPLSTSRLEMPCVTVLKVEVPKGTVGYIKDHAGRVYSKSHTRVISSLAECNEVGCYKPGGFDAGRYKVRYVFRLYPPVEYDGKLCHLNLKLADEHIPYLSVSILIENNGLIERVYPHPPSLEVVEGSNIELRGYSWKDELLEVELLLKPEALKYLDCFVRKIDDVESRTVWPNLIYSFQYSVLKILSWIVEITVLAVPFLLLVIYIKYGRERSYTVPRYLSFVPNPARKPWVVNLVFKGDALDFDEDGFYATILDLHRRGKIRIIPRDGDLLIKIVDKNVDDRYERRVLRFLSRFSVNDTVDTRYMREKIEELKDDRLRISELSRELRYLVSSPDRRVALKFMISGRSRVAVFMVVSIILLVVSIVLADLIPGAGLTVMKAMIGSGVLLVQSIVAISAPSTLFGRWKGVEYKEKLEWDAFRRLLSDLALIRQYAPQDLSMWGEWLVYGTALGVGDKVVEAMKELNVHLPEASILTVMPTTFRPIITAASPPSKGGVTGGFGAGGGFGGGGGGAR